MNIRVFIFSCILLSSLAHAQTTCLFTVTPDHVDFTADGGDAIFKVTSNGTCGWTGTSDSAWVTPGPQSITDGQGSIIFQAASNQGPARKAILTIAGQAIPATQAEGHAPAASPVPAITSAGIVNGADYTGGGLVPGEVISIFGDNLGPAILAPLQIGADGTTLFTTLGGTQVLIGGDAVPLIFSQQKQVSAIVPYSISDKTLIDVQVGGKSATVTYAGGAPGLVAGVLQVNVKLPDDVVVGNSVPVVLTWEQRPARQR